MRISVIGPTYPYKGGISHFTTILVKELRKKDKVNFISWKRQYPAFLYPVELKDTQSKKPIKEDAHFLLDFFNPFSWVIAFFSIKRFKTEKLILTWVSPIQAPIYFTIALLTKLLTKAEVVYICHNVFPHEKHFYDIAFLKLAFFKGDTFIVHSSDDKKILERFAKNKKIILGFHPVYDIFNTGKKYDIEKIKKELGLKEKVLLFFGYIRPYKGLKYLINAIPEIIKIFPDVSLLVVGDFWSEDKQSYFDLISNLQIHEHVIMINDYVPDEEVGKYFTIADTVVLPYISATQSGVSKIAYSFNKPVISTAVGGLEDEAKSGQFHYVIKSKSTQDIVEKVKFFFKEPHISPNQTDNQYKYKWFDYTSLISNT